MRVSMPWCRRFLERHELSFFGKDRPQEWWPAHDLAHALVAPRSRRWLKHYGLGKPHGDAGPCPAGSHCVHMRRDKTRRVSIAHAWVEERAADLVTFEWLVAMRLSIAVISLSDYSSLGEPTLTESIALLRRRKLWPVPTDTRRITDHVLAGAEVRPNRRRIAAGGARL